MTKEINYTAEQTTALVAAYQAGTAPNALAEQFGKSVRSIVAKLSREGVYVSPNKAEGTSKGVTKADMVSMLRARFGFAGTEFASLEKASKEDLERLLAQF